MAFVDAVFGEKQGVIFLDVVCLTYTVLKEGWFTIQDDMSSQTQEALMRLMGQN